MKYWHIEQIFRIKASMEIVLAALALNYIIYKCQWLLFESIETLPVKSAWITFMVQMLFDFLYIGSWHHVQLGK